jgi:hypothetical protein
LLSTKLFFTAACAVVLPAFAVVRFTDLLWLTAAELPLSFTLCAAAAVFAGLETFVPPTAATEKTITSESRSEMGLVNFLLMYIAPLHIIGHSKLYHKL